MAETPIFMNISLWNFWSASLRHQPEVRVNRLLCGSENCTKPIRKWKFLIPSWATYLNEYRKDWTVTSD
jgi:hypothetical protein